MSSAKTFPSGRPTIWEKAHRVVAGASSHVGNPISSRHPQCFQKIGRPLILLPVLVSSLEVAKRRRVSGVYRRFLLKSERRPDCRRQQDQAGEKWRQPPTTSYQ